MTTAPRSSSAQPIDIGLLEEHRLQIAEGLGRLLADTFVLYGKTHGFHWNVTGPMFNTLHLMFEGQYIELWNALDAIAERIRSLGCRPLSAAPASPAWLRSAKARESLPPPTWCGSWCWAMRPWPAPPGLCLCWPMTAATSPAPTCSPSGSRSTRRPPGCCAACLEG
jgi:hypothetical protein